MHVLSINTTAHREYLNTPVWKSKRLEVLNFYGPVCNRCKQYGNDVHHKTYERVGGNELLEDLEVLCRECHQAHHRIHKIDRVKHERKVNRCGLVRYLTNTQKDFLVKKYSLCGHCELKFEIQFNLNRIIANDAANIAGYDAVYGKDTVSAEVCRKIKEKFLILKNNNEFKEKEWRHIKGRTHKSTKRKRWRKLRWLLERGDK